MDEDQKHLNIQGYNVIELTAAIAILAILSLIALPSFLRQGILAEVSNNIDSMNRAQQAYFWENKEPDKKGKFAKEIGKLELDIPTDTKNYKYLLRASDSASFHYAIAKDKELKGYAGAVFMVETASSETLAIMCIAAEPGQLIPAEPQMENGVPTCGTGTEPL
ncbi:MAG: type IV pilin-like G/H family protein [Hormoscilla sp.]